MALSDHIIKEADFSAKDIVSLSDRPNADGMSANALKERFDAGAKKVLMPKVNALIDELLGQNGASGIGLKPIDGLSGYDVQNVLIAMKLLLDTKKSTETVDIELGKKFDKVNAQSLVKSISFAEGTGVFTITKYDGTVETIDTMIEKIPLDVRLDGQEFVLTLSDGTEQRVDISKFLTDTEVKSSDTITLAIENGAIVARIASGSVKLAHLSSEVTSYFDGKTQVVQEIANAVKVSEQNALLSANKAESAKQQAQECQENACQCAMNAAGSEANALDSANNASQSASEAERSAEVAAQAVTDAAIIVSGGTVIMHENGTAYQMKMDDTGLYLQQVQVTKVAPLSLGDEDTGYYVETNTGTYNLRNVESTEEKLDPGEYNFDLL